MSSQLIMFQRFYFFALSKSTGIESFFSFRTSQLLYLLRANRVEFERIYNLSTPLILLRAKRVGFESFLLLTPLYTCKYTDSNKDIIIIMHTFLYNDNAKTTSQIPLILLWAKRVGLRGCVSSQTPLNLLGAKKTTERFWMWRGKHILTGEQGPLIFLCHILFSQKGLSKDLKFCTIVFKWKKIQFYAICYTCSIF